jgi:HAD superfamily hydrolase (TIGR01509 family)
LQDEITRQLLDYELTMHFEYIDGVVDFMKELREKGVKLAIVTSSNDAKMANAYREHPELKTMVDYIVTADRVTHSKPHPECFLLGAEMLGVEKDNCIVFEDSFHGIEAGNRAGMKVIGLATTNSAEAIAAKCALVIPDFTDFTFEKMKGVLQ